MAIVKELSPEPKKRAAFWVDHVIKYGNSHLRSHGLDLPWYQYVMLDIHLLIISVDLLDIILNILKAVSLRCGLSTEMLKNQ